MAFLNLSIKSSSLQNLVLLITFLACQVFGSSSLAEVKRICPRLEGQTFTCPVPGGGGGGGAVCNPGSCDAYAANKYTCESVALCDGRTCQGTKVKTCSGVCYVPTFKDVPIEVASGGGQGACRDADGGHNETTCVPVCSPEGGCTENCTTEFICGSGYGTLPIVCNPSTKSCIDDFVEVPNTPTNCVCRCGDTGMEKPPIPSCEVGTCTPVPGS